MIRCGVSEDAVDDGVNVVRVKAAKPATDGGELGF